jgi:hypothetical protein
MRTAAAQSNLAPSEILIACRSDDQSGLAPPLFGACSATGGFRIELLTLARARKTRERAPLRSCLELRRKCYFIDSFHLNVCLK